MILYFFKDTETTEIYTDIPTLALLDALPTSRRRRRLSGEVGAAQRGGRAGAVLVAQGIVRGERRAPRQGDPRAGIHGQRQRHGGNGGGRSEEQTSELQSLMRNSYAVFCLIKKTTLEIGRQQTLGPVYT